MRALLEVQVTRSPRSMRASRHHHRALSSQASRSTSGHPELLTGWDARVDWLARTLRRVPRLVGFAEKRVFAPSLSPAHHALMFVALNAPQRLDLDVPQFLEGAAVATKRVLEDASDDAFVQLVRASSKLESASGNTVSQSSSAVRRMRDYCLPPCFEQLQTVVQRQLAQGVHSQTLDVHVERTHLTRVQYACVSARDHSIDGLRCTTDHGTTDVQAADEVDEPLAVERLQLQVEVRTLEWLRRTRHTHSATSVTQFQQRNVYVARFSSVVTNPDELDWRLASIAVRTRGKPIEVSSSYVTHRPAIQ